MSHDFDALAEEAKSAVSQVGAHTLWKAAMSLPEWYFVATVGGDEAEPVVAAVDGKPHLLAFTDEQRADAFSKSRAAKRAGAPTPVLNMGVGDAVAYCRDLRAQDVEGILFNSGQYAFQASLSHVLDMYSRYAS